MSTYYEVTPQAIRIREKSDGPLDPVAMEITADEMLSIVADFRERKRREAEEYAACSAELARRLALA